MNIDRRTFAVTLAAAAMIAVGADAAAQPQPADASAPRVADVMVLHATQQPGAGSIDPQIGKLPQLTKPPFSAYNTYKLVGHTSLPLEKGKPQVYTLVNKRDLQVVLQDTTKDGRFQIRTAIKQPDGKDFLKLLDVTTGPNETFFVAGQTYDRGMLVIGITVK